jgi:hypothetical protein
MRKYNNAVVGEKLTRYESSVRGCIVIMEQPIARVPQFSSSTANDLPQMVKKIAVELSVHGLAFGGKFMVHNPSNVKKHDEQLLVMLRLWLTYFSLGDPGLFHCEDCLGIIPVDLTLVTSDDPQHEG